MAPLSPSRKLFTIAYIVLGIGSAGFAITTLFTYLFEGPVMNTFKERRMNAQKKRLQNHHIGPTEKAYYTNFTIFLG